MPTRFSLALGLAALLGPECYAQATRAQPYNAQLRTDPAVGNIQGIQRYGRSLKTDPDEGEGFSYHVYPIQDSPSVVVAGAGVPASGSGQPGGILGRGAALELFQQSQETARTCGKQRLQERLKALPAGKRNELLQTLKSTGHLPPGDPLSDTFLNQAIDDPAAMKILGAEDIYNEWQRARTGLEKAHSQLQGSMAAMAPPAAGPPAIMPAGYYPAPVSPYPPPFDPTEGLRNVPGTPPGALLPLAPGPVPAFRGGLSPLGFGLPPTAAFGPLPAAMVVGADAKAGLVAEEIYHQPLIQVKVRVIEVARTDELAVSSVLDYISNNGAPSLISGNNINNNQQRTTALTRFPGAAGLIGFPTSGTPNLTNLTGAGLLVNVTTEHLNFIARLLATEFRADMITAPEVVTLNGQNVEFVAGQKTPFQLGQNVASGSTMNIQQLFYKHTGTYVSVTPKIVNWGFHGEGEGEVPLVAGDVLDWYALLSWMVTLGSGNWALPQVPSATQADGTVVFKPDDTFWGRLLRTTPAVPVPLDIKSWALNQLKRYTKRELVETLNRDPAHPVILPCHSPDGCGCNWTPEDCTIDLAVVVRLSEPGSIELDQLRTDMTGKFTVSTTTENNVRALADIVQVKSGHGIVLAGLIGEREFKDISKVPLLGDIPIVGALFRSSDTGREKTEVLVFIEAQVLDPRPEEARAQSAADFRLSHPFVAGDLLDNPLEFGLYRAGFGTYLPPHSKEEGIFWERFGRSVRRACTELDDIFLK